MNEERPPMAGQRWPDMMGRGRGWHEGRPYYRPYGGLGGGRGIFGPDSRVRKLKMPVFEGEDAHGWIYRVERYFAVNGLTEDEKLTAAALCLEGKALAWYQWCEQRDPMHTWEDFKTQVLDRFRPLQEGDYHEQFFALTQQGTVGEYREKFELLSSRLRGISEDTMKSNFMKGLKPEIRATVRTLEPRGIVDTMKLAQMVEDKKRTEQSDKGGSTPFYGTDPYSGNSKFPPTEGRKEASKEPSNGARSGTHFKRLTESEIQNKRAQGLCFRCNEKFSPGHRCKDRSLQVLTVGDEKDVRGVIEAEEDEVVEEERLHQD